MSYFTLGIGLLVLVKGADMLVGSASRIAKLLNVPAFIIGLFIIAIGTSAPEAAIGVFSGIQGTNLVTLGDVIGSSIINILVVIGITAMIFPLEVESTVPRREMPISIFVQVCLIFMIFTTGTLSRLEATVLLTMMFLFSGYVYVKLKKSSEKEKSITGFEKEVFDYVESQQEVLHEEILEEEGTNEASVKDTKLPAEEPKSDSVLKLLISLFIGLAGLIGGANLGINSAVKIAQTLGLSEVFIGMTVVAFGTSLPELITSLVAVYKREQDIAVGNIIGSNIFNVLFVLGISGLLHPITVTSDVFFDLFVMLSASILLFIPTFFFGKISKRTGFIYVAVYIIYLSIKLNSLG